MPQTVLTCADVDAADLEAAYLQQRLDDERQAAYEAHYFACERCWSRLRRATEVRAAFASRARARRVHWAVWALPAAAVLTVLVLQPPRESESPTPVPALRGTAELLAARATLTGDSVRVTWPAHPGADAYRVRGFGADGALRWSRETRDTALAAARAGAAVVDVAALDPLRAVIAQSALIRPDP